MFNSVNLVKDSADHSFLNFVQTKHRWCWCRTDFIARFPALMRQQLSKMSYGGLRFILVFHKTINSWIVTLFFHICKFSSLNYQFQNCLGTIFATTNFSVRFGPAALMRCVQLGNSTLLRFLILKVDSHLDQLIRIIRQY